MNRCLLGLTSPSLFFLFVPFGLRLDVILWNGKQTPREVRQAFHRRIALDVDLHVFRDRLLIEDRNGRETPT